MSVTPLPRQAGDSGLRVVKGSRRKRRPSMAPWTIMVAIAVVAFFALGFARTSLDGSAFELAELTRAIEGQEATNEQLRLEVARLTNPARIAPLAEELGMVIPEQTHTVVVDLDELAPVVAESETEGASQ